MTADENVIDLPVDLARKLVGPPGLAVDGWTVVHHEQLGSREWASVHELVIERDGLLYGATYEQGLSEGQGPRPWDDVEQARFYRVEKRTRLLEVAEFVPVEKPGGAR